jgi:hypothetical protein
MADDPSDAKTDGSGPDPTNVLVFLLFATALVLILVASVEGPPQRREGDLGGSLTNSHVAWSVYLAGIGIAVLFVRGSRRPRRYRKPRQALCTHCLHPTREPVHFCPRCSAPQTFFAATGPYEQVFAQMWILGKAAHQPSRRLHVLGLALVALPLVLEPIIAVVPLALDPDAWIGNGMDLWAWVLYGTASLVTAAIYALLLRYAWRNWRRRVRDPAAAPAASAYGHPPWWTYDRDGDVPDPDDATEGDPDAPAADPTHADDSAGG